MAEIMELVAMHPIISSGAIIVISGALFYMLDSLKSKTQEQTNSNHSKFGLPGGLYNYGNTCFMNSVIQAIVSLQHLQDYIDHRCEDDEEMLVTESILELCLMLNPRQSPHFVTAPTGLTRAMAKKKGGNSHLLGYQQQGFIFLI